MILEIKNLVKNFNQAGTIIKAVDNVSFGLKQNKTLAVVGSSGSGKTTLLSMIAGLESPDSGEILFNQRNIVNLSESELSSFRSQNMGIVFQQYHLMPHLTAFENVCLPLEISKMDNIEERADKVLEEVGLSERKSHFPSQLSGGECQRVAIARALVASPKVLLADEPSGSLDTKTGNKVIELIFKLVSQSDLSLILVTHDQELASQCDSSIKMDSGKLL